MARLGDRIKSLRFQKNMTQAELAAAIGTTKASISNYEHRQRNPPYPVLCKMAAVFGVEVSELLACMSLEESVVDDNQIKIKRPRRIKRLLAAFDSLTDEAQLKAIEYVEVLGLVPMYQKKLPNALQQYLFEDCGLRYELIEDTVEESGQIPQQHQEVENGGYSIRKLSYYNKTKKSKTPYWDFFYCTSETELDEDGDIRDMAKDMVDSVIGRFTDDYEHRLVFVADNERLLDRISDYYRDRMESPDTRPWMSAPKQIPALFLLVEPGSWEVKDEQNYEPEYNFM